MGRGEQWRKDLLRDDLQILPSRPLAIDTAIDLTIDMAGSMYREITLVLYSFQSMVGRALEW